MADTIHDMSRAVGALEATVKNLTETWLSQDKKATEGRRALYSKFDELKTEVTKLSERVGNHENTLALIFPTVMTSENERQQAIGSKKTIAVIWTIIVGLISGTAVAIVEVIRMFWGKH